MRFLLGTKCDRVLSLVMSGTPFSNLVKNATTAVNATVLVAKKKYDFDPSTITSGDPASALAGVFTALSGGDTVTLPGGTVTKITGSNESKSFTVTPAKTPRRRSTDEPLPDPKTTADANEAAATALSYDSGGADPAADGDGTDAENPADAATETGPAL